MLYFSIMYYNHKDSLSCSTYNLSLCDNKYTYFQKFGEYAYEIRMYDEHA